MDAPAHFVPDGRSVDSFTAAELVVEAAVIDARDACERDPGHAIGVAEIEDFEASTGGCPGRRGAGLHGLDRHRDNAERLLGGSGTVSCGSLDSPRQAVSPIVERGVAGIAIDTLTVYVGAASDFPVHQRPSRRASSTWRWSSTSTGCRRAGRRSCSAPAAARRVGRSGPGADAGSGLGPGH